MSVLAGGGDERGPCRRGSGYVQQVAQLFQHALRPVPPLGELGQGAARGVHVGGAEARRQRPSASARHLHVAHGGRLGVCKGEALGLRLRLCLGVGAVNIERRQIDVHWLHGIVYGHGAEVCPLRGHGKAGHGREAQLHDECSECGTH